MPAGVRLKSVLPQILSIAAAVLLMIALLPLAGGAQQQEDFCEDPDPAPFEDRAAIAPVHVENVDCAYEVDITRGRIESDGKRYFHPVADISRGQFAAFLFRTLEVMGRADDLPPPRQPNFSDVPPTHTFYEEIHRLAAAEIILGYADGRFGPADPIRRDQTASLLLRAAEWVLDREIDPEGGPYFSDTQGNVHRANIDAAFEQGFVQGRVAPTQTQEGEYAPSENTTRQQMATVMVRFLRRLSSLASPSPSPSPTGSPSPGPGDELCDFFPMLPGCMSPSPTPTATQSPGTPPPDGGGNPCGSLPEPMQADCESFCEQFPDLCEGYCDQFPDECGAALAHAGSVRLT